MDIEETRAPDRCCSTAAAPRRRRARSSPRKPEEPAAEPKPPSGPRARRAKAPPPHRPSRRCSCRSTSRARLAAPRPTTPSTSRSRARCAEVDDLAAAFPGLANRATSTPLSDDEIEDEEIAKQLATLSPRAASAIRAAAEATTDEEREAALDAVDDEDQPLNRGLLLKFLSSVKS